MVQRSGESIGSASAPRARLLDPRAAAPSFDDVIAACRAVGIDVDAVRSHAIASGRVLATAHASRSSTSLEADWYDSLRAGAPKFDVYETAEYVGEAWACWVRYSRGYVRSMTIPYVDGGPSIVDEWKDVELVVDLGCGIGASTAALAAAFPRAEVVGTNVAGSYQWKVAARFATARRFSLASSAPVSNGRKAIVFASEYFEHFDRPVDHLRDVVAAVDPASLVIANAFTARAIGHFDEYRVDGTPVPNNATARLFNNELRRLGYSRVATRFWNGRPAYWKRLRSAD